MLAAATIEASNINKKILNVFSHDSFLLKKNKFESKFNFEFQLWYSFAPPFVQEKIESLIKSLNASGDDWDVWARWYRARLDGVPPDPEFDLAVARIPNEDWDKGPAHVNAIIKRLEEEARKRKEPVEAPPTQFFISYTKADEDKARQIASILEDAGYRTFAMFKDIPNGANFVSEMQSALQATLAGNGRVVALYSPGYFASDFCQSEWNAAFAADPSGAKRTLVPFLITQSDLPPLAQPVVFTDLVALTREETVAAVLKAIAAPKKIPPSLPNVSGAFDIRLNAAYKLAAFPGLHARLTARGERNDRDRLKRLEALQVLIEQLLEDIEPARGQPAKFQFVDQ